MKRVLGEGLLVIGAIALIYGMAHLSVAALRSEAGELGQSLELTIEGARWIGAALVPFIGGLFCLVRLSRRRAPRRPAASPPLQLLAQRPGGLPVSALTPWRRPPPASH